MKTVLRKYCSHWATFFIHWICLQHLEECSEKTGRLHRLIRSRWVAMLRGSVGHRKIWGKVHQFVNKCVCKCFWKQNREEFRDFSETAEISVCKNVKKIQVVIVWGCVSVHGNLHICEGTINAKGTAYAAIQIAPFSRPTAISPKQCQATLYTFYNSVAS